MSVNLLLGLQWGDEGKGKIVDVLTQSYDIIARFQGGPNAGHTLEFEGNKHVLHTIPSGIFHPKAINLIGNGVVIDPVIFKKELENLAPYKINFSSKLLISKKAHLILPTHRLLDAASEASKGKAKIGSTLKGIGPTYMDKTGRNGLRVGDIFTKSWKIRYKTLVQKHLRMLDYYDSALEFDIRELENTFFEALSLLKKCKVVDSENYLFKAQEAGKRILAEGAQGSLLDVDFGTYPYVTSSTTTAAGACTGLGIAPNKIKEVFGIFKAYTTRVGGGPFPTELFNEIGKQIAEVGQEFGATTGRARRVGWIDLVALKYAIRVNGVTQLMMMKGDVLSGIKTIKVCTHYKIQEEVLDYFPFDIQSDSVIPQYIDIRGWEEDLTKIEELGKLPKKFIDYIDFLEKELEIPIKIVSVGPDRKQTIFR
ncbi:MAG: adenylosuccinate synthase [Flavobacteriaceae bacterium TMED121]|nr:MAG: adenylosuccinate synthase [Flavobacteriaceae bacterium TMED121]|tara:strand:+ start:4491 stop:5762 length:1272 start_codon:yes stop_codon:yes gene_type:complete